jgi:hypothetical protein
MSERFQIIRYGTSRYWAVMAAITKHFTPHGKEVNHATQEYPVSQAPWLAA